MNRRGAARWAVIIVLAAAVTVALWQREHVSVESVRIWLEGAGWWAPVLFMVLYAAAAVLFLPGAVFTVAGGALFGPVGGTLLSLAGATSGALAAFLIARYVAAEWVQERTGGRLQRIMEGVDREGWRFVAFTRLVPLFPFNLLNYAFGLTRIGALPYAAASFICMSPGAAAYAYLGYAGREAVAGGEDVVRKVLVAAALLGFAAFLPPMVYRWRRRSRS